MPYLIGLSFEGNWTPLLDNIFWTSRLTSDFGSITLSPCQVYLSRSNYKCMFIYIVITIWNRLCSWQQVQQSSGISTNNFGWSCIGTAVRRNLIKYRPEEILQPHLLIILYSARISEKVFGNGLTRRELFSTLETFFR